MTLRVTFLLFYVKVLHCVYYFSFLFKSETYSRPSCKPVCGAKMVGSLKWLTIFSKSSILVNLQYPESTSANIADRNTTIK